jgi:oligoribonuclease (3'-5' exoribonuclease)
MPKLNQFLHHRIVDVSSIKSIVNSFCPKLFYKKKNAHRAFEDIK